MGFMNHFTTGGPHIVPTSYLDSWNFENPGTSGNRTSLTPNIRNESDSNPITVPFSDGLSKPS